MTAPFGQGLDPSDLPAIIRALMCSQIDKALHDEVNDRNRELGGHIERTDDGAYRIADLHWAEGLGEVPLILNPAISDQDRPFYIHFHDDQPSPVSTKVYPGPSDDDLKNSKDYGIWQIVVDHRGYVYVINDEGGLVLPNGEVISYEDATRAVRDGLYKSYPELEDEANSWGDVDGTCHSA